ncbi:ionic transporter y4hA [Nocardioides marmoriginsengisoli]|uniref:Ionic transporter y4hA n=1 Tax=Nocardioides marmoriginsengisoli TaxID=661483 RepID=A0A3N0CIM2_9ACTN|nr:ionic transporter y4hA [Nocardioides marmoriginsengisoli]RNL63290.1 ionic transporter y4hA [Nocardioides marmoriginsengisoli]
MSDAPAARIRDSTTYTPIAAAIVLAALWGSHPSDAALVALVPLLGGAVFSAVHHAEVVAHRIGEPFGSLLLAVAVTVIEVGLIVMLMTSDKDTSMLARDTVFAAVMICLNGIVGLVLLVGALKHHLAIFNPEGTGAALATVITLAAITLILPRFSTSEPGPEFTPGQLVFAAVASLVLYGMFVFTQTVRHREFFLPVDRDGDGVEDPHEITDRDALWSLVLLLIALVAVVGLAKIESSGIERAVTAAGLPQAVVGVIIAVLVLAPESIAAVKAAARDQVQTGLNLAYGSAMASIGLTIPAIAVASIWLDGPLTLGLTQVQIVLLVMTVFVSILTVVPGRSKPLQGGVHLVLFATFVYLSISP